METNQSLFESPTSVKDLKPGDSAVLFVELRSREVRKTRSGQDYLDLVIGDATGSMPGKMWADAIRKWGSDFSPGDLLKIEGRVEVYRERNQIVVEKIRQAEPAEIPDPSVLRKGSPYDPDELFGELKRISGTLAPPQLAELVEYVLDEHQDALKTFPAARMIHHAYPGGLLEHVVTVTRKVEAILGIEANINRNIAIAGAILHDIGKVRELAPAGKTRTMEGRLIGHVILGAELLREAAWEKGIKDQIWLRELEHIVLSHHGETQFGAPVRPLTREAILVHFIDN
ncbi:MAG: HD domain-containing protein, partial [Deltaproteobacteria bacterium]|nr:HD domain-containing protein [Deltaproteobacteria bacterium]